MASINNYALQTASINNYALQTASISHEGTGGASGIFDPLITYRTTTHIPVWSGAFSATTTTPSVASADLSEDNADIVVNVWAMNSLTFTDDGVIGLSIPDTISITSMSNMFKNATSANPDVSSWNVSNVTNMSGMFVGSALSTANYDALLIAWATQPLQNNVPFSAGSTKYTPGGAAEAARTTLIQTFGWVITDGGAV